MQLCFLFGMLVPHGVTLHLFLLNLCDQWQRGVAVCREPMAWLHADASSKRLDDKFLVSQRIQMPLPHLACIVPQVR